jgi:hypothetical protein
VSHIAPVLPNDGDPGWGDTLNAAINQIVTASNTHDDQIASIGSGFSTPSATTSTQGIIQLAGDLTGTAGTPVLKNILTAGSVGSATAIPVITFDAKGRVTAATTAAPLVPNTFSSAPPIGYVVTPPGYTASATGTPTSGKLYWYPFMVPSAYTVNSLYTNLTTAAVGGTLSFQAALYADNGAGLPDGTRRIIPPLNFTLASTGNISAATAGSIPLAAGRYWVLVLYQATVAPTTAPVFTCLSTNSWGLGVDTGTALGTVINGYEMSGQTAFPVAAITSGYAPTTSGSIPLVGLHRSA